eukprot:SAG25_NODE_861_length_5027_cov_2.052557_2_plen_163_part_00
MYWRFCLYIGHRSTMLVSRGMSKLCVNLCGSGVVVIIILHARAWRTVYHHARHSARERQQQALEAAAKRAQAAHADKLVQQRDQELAYVRSVSTTMLPCFVPQRTHHPHHSEWPPRVTASGAVAHGYAASPSRRERPLGAGGSRAETYRPGRASPSSRNSKV